MRELLIRYLLGELDAQQQQHLEERLRNSPELRSELAYLRTCFAAARDTEKAADQPPRGLAERTTERVTAWSGAGRDPDELFFGPRTAAAEPDPPAGALGWSLADLTVAGGVFLAVSMLLFPALRDSRDATRRRGCENNLRNFYIVSAKYAEDHQSYLPRVNPQDYAGILVIRLVKEGYAAPEEMAQWMLCASSPLAEQVRSGEVRIPRIDKVRMVPGSQPAQLCRMASGSYAVRLGYVDQNQYHWIRDDGSDREPLMSDEPDFQVAGIRSANHDGHGQNVLYFSGRVAFETSSTVRGGQDHIFLNALGMPAAGRGPRDVVLVSGDKTPGVELPVGGQ